MKQVLATAALFLIVLVPLWLWAGTAVVQQDPSGNCVRVHDPDHIYDCQHMPDRYSVEVVGYR